MHPAERYIQGVQSGKILTCEFVKLAVARHIKDLEDGPDRGLYFDPEAAQKVIDFFHILNHYEGEWAGTPIHLEDWQQFILWVAYGWKREDGTRRFRNGYIEVARKNGKSTLLGGLGLYGLMLDDENAPQIYCGATKADQAAIVVNIAGRIAKGTPWLENRLRFQEHLGIIKRVIYEKKAGFIAPLGRDSKTQDGFNPHMGIMDERHAMSTDDVPNVVKSGMGARAQPFQWSITTAGFNRQLPCYNLRSTIIQILKGKKEDDSTFGIIYTLDNDNEWTNPEMWIKANPCLNVSVKMSFLQDEFTQALNEGGSTEVNFKTKNLNIWTDAAETWIQEHIWKKCMGSANDLDGKRCYGGLDLASTRDITALTLCFPIGEKRVLKHFFWVPEDTVNAREDKAPYKQWVKAGWLKTTPGNITDYNFIKATILDLKDRYDIHSIAFDRWNSSQLVIDLQDEGVIMTPFGQGFASMSAPTKAFEKHILEGSLIHDGNPVMEWMMSNIAIKRDPAGNIKIDKEKSTEKVDGPVSAVMALGECMTFNTQPQGGTVDIW